MVERKQEYIKVLYYLMVGEISLRKQVTFVSSEEKGGWAGKMTGICLELTEKVEKPGILTQNLEKKN